MGYFDYLEDKTKEQREFRFYDIWAKVGFFVFLGTLLLTIASVLVFTLAIPLGQNIYLDILLGCTIAVGIIGIVFSKKAVKMAKGVRKTSDLGKFSMIWGIFFVLVNCAGVVANTWMYFV